VEPYSLIKENTSIYGLTKSFKEEILENFYSTKVGRVVFIESPGELASDSEYPLEVKTRAPDFGLNFETTGEEFHLSGVYMSFAGFDPISLAWNHVKANRFTCKGNIKQKMLSSLMDQKTRCPVTPKNQFVDPRNIGRCHTFGKPLDLMVICSKKHSTVEQFGSKVVLSTQPFVSSLGYRQYSVISIGSAAHADPSKTRVQMKIEIQGAELED
jgi:hypothetical protein